MEIFVENLGKKFIRDWVFRNLNLNFKSEESYAVLGVNGSGKSTLLKVLSGILPASEGTIKYVGKNGVIHPNDFFQHITFSAPYQELIEELTLLEFLKFHFKFKRNRLQSIEEVTQKMNLSESSNKQLKYLSSGMKQRLKLGLCFFSECDVMLLDEPTTNLDDKGIEWYHQQIELLPKGILRVVCSNRKLEYEFCTKNIFLSSKE